VLACVDKLGREPEEKLAERLGRWGVGVGELREFIAGGGDGVFRPVLEAVGARGLGGFVEVDLSIVRGLAYYTGLVFEVFDRGGRMRALAGGGRYDGLIAGLSEGAVDLPAMGFGMGDVVLGNLIDAVPAAARRMEEALRPSSDVYVVVADEGRRGEALAVVQGCREAGLAVNFPLKAVKVGKQFQEAGAVGARHAVVVGGEWPMVKVKDLGTRVEEEVEHHRLIAWLRGAGAD
jgi:histidyl-tRNA synthetase